MLRVKSAKDVWFRMLFWIVVAIIGLCFFFIPGNALLIGFAVDIPMLGFLFWICFGTYYEFREEYLYCRSGPFLEKIPYDCIKSVRLCENLLSSIALSSKRIEIRQHDKGFVTGTTYISPINREEFLEELKRKCGSLEDNQMKE